MQVTEWSDVPPHSLMTVHPEIYDKDDTDPSRELIDVSRYPMYDVFGDEIPVYTKHGFKIFRRIPEQFEPCGSLMDLRF